MTALRKSLFTRYFTLCASITLASIAVLEILLVLLSANYFSNERFSSMQIRAAQVAQFVSENYEENKGEYIESDSISKSFTIMASVSEADVLLTHPNGEIAYAATFQKGEEEQSRIASELIGKSVGEASLKLTEDGMYKSVGKLNDLYSQRAFVVGVPIETELGKIGGIFIISPISDLGLYLQDVFRMFLLGSCFAVIISFWISYYSTEALVRPLSAMAKAVNSFAKGDFSVRVPVEGDEEVEQLAKAFNQMAESLALQEQSGRTFVANVSHELKTPMMTIGGFIDGVLDGTIPQERSAHYLKIVSDEIHRLSRMVVSMLNMSRIEAGEMKLNPTQVDLGEVIVRTVIGFERKIEEKNIEIEGLDSEKIYVEADNDLVSQIAYNLIENAVKFTPDGGTISVIYNAKGKMVTTSIRNTGAGIPKEELTHLFDRFYKSDRSRSVDKSGVGLGLHIVKSLVHLHGGEVSVASEQGEYTEFTFTLPKFVQSNMPAIFRKSDKTK